MPSAESTEPLGYTLSVLSTRIEDLDKRMGRMTNAIIAVATIVAGLGIWNNQSTYDTLNDLTSKIAAATTTLERTQKDVEDNRQGVEALGGHYEDILDLFRNLERKIDDNTETAVGNYERLNQQQADIKRTIEDLSAKVRALDAASTPSPTSVEPSYDGWGKGETIILPALGGPD